MYKPKLNIKETQIAIQTIKFSFTKQLSKLLNLTRVSAPLFVETNSLINDGLNGEAPVRFIPKELNKQLDIVHSLAKWKRLALKKYNFDSHEGLWTDMNAIRQEETLDNKHSIYVDQWDWELIINEEDRNITFLKSVVNKIFRSIKYVENKINLIFSNLKRKLPETLTFVSSEELYNKYPELTPEQREKEFAKIHKAFFVYKIGYKLPDGVEHSKRAFDYDDWNLNGDLIVYDEQNDDALELSSLGIRVNKESLAQQIKIMNISDSKLSTYHQQILKNNLPFTIGGGIGQSRLCMFLLEKKHIGEVQVSVWPEEFKSYQLL
ncbi:aspartate--ammonia ligase [Mycoplasma sp. Mirounga ES2805-ORL]|uniref:aspartate--ammonia ligase n=1 Tax=Mycoplasma sp. Mirounga ES2805-ORL TaxID=754514 RepID=UPI00197C4153|nr:aspartate--ammonia ligase [Mycoplasma sp. Mirounga ES2805-ORL]QSF13511.1 aspartate--ammonia ligase [Mycoplasma sp. Mirounga ES2805-ORL]